MKSINRVLQQTFAAIEPYSQRLVTRTNHINPYTAYLETNLSLLEVNYGRKVERKLYHALLID